jgi:hypothetical protein
MDDSAQARIGVHESDCLINAPGATDVKMFNGVLCLKVIIGLAHIDTRATAAHIRQSLGRLPAKAAKLNFDITDFNDCAKLQQSALLFRGEESADLLVNLFAAMGSVPDPSFQSYIERVKDD